MKSTFEHPKLVAFKKFIEQVYDSNNDGSKERADVLAENANRIACHCKYVLIGTFLGLALYSAYPCYDVLLNRQLTVVSPLATPLFDDSSLLGSIILTMINTITAGVAVVGNFTFSCVFLTIVNFYEALLSLVEDDFRTFDKMWQKKNQFDDRIRAHAFKNIMKQLMDMAR